MAQQVMTPENLKKTIDNLVEKNGVKAFCISTDFCGTALAPSKKIPLYRVPVALDGEFFEHSNLSLAMKGMYFVPVSDLDILSPLAKDAYEQNLKGA